MGLGGVYTEVVPPSRLVSTEYFDEKWYEGDATNTWNSKKAAAKPR